MIKIGVCDDSAQSRFTLTVMLERQLETFDKEPFCYEFSSGERMLSWLSKYPGELDILFLDIEMPGMDGMETARKIRSADANIMIVFVTGFADYVFDGYAVNALDYLLKPVDPKRLNAVLKRMLSVLELRAPESYSFKNMDGLFRIPRNEILYLQSEGRKIHLATAVRTYTFYEKLDTVQKELGRGFVRIHQRYLVRCDKVTAFRGDHVEIGSVHLPVSRTNRADAMQAISENILGGDEEE